MVVETVRDIITDALLDLESATLGQTLQGGSAAHAMRVLSRMLKAWQNEHSAPFHLYASQTVTLTTASSYTMDPARPIKITNVNFKFNSIETPLTEMTRDEYDNLPNKAVTGRPTMFYYDRQRAGSGSLLYVWPALASATTEELIITYEREHYDMDDLNETIDVPSEWAEAVTKGLAWRLIGTYGREARKQQIPYEAKAALDAALGAGVDGTSVYWRADA